MTAEQDPQIANFEEACADFLTPIHERDGLNEERFQTVVVQLRHIIERFRSESAIPKHLARVFLDLHCALLADLEHYTGEECNRLNCAFAEILRLTDECL